MKKLMFAAAVGVALMWFYDPTSGSHRRESLQRKANRGTQRVVMDPPVLISDGGTERIDVPRVVTR